MIEWLAFFVAIVALCVAIGIAVVVVRKLDYISDKMAADIKAKFDQLVPPLLRDPNRRGEAYAFLSSVIVGIYRGKVPVCTAVFISENRALTAYHDAKPEPGTILYARSAAAGGKKAAVKKWTFRVVGVSAGNAVAVLERIAGPVPAAFAPLQRSKTFVLEMALTEVAVVSFGIAAVARGGEKKNTLFLGHAFHATTVSSCGTRHFVYPTPTGPGDSGGAVLTLDGQLAGLHLGGWNYADSPPPSPPEKAKSVKGAGAGAAAAAGAGAGGGSDGSSDGGSSDGGSSDGGSSDGDSSDGGNDADADAASSVGGASHATGQNKDRIIAAGLQYATRSAIRSVANLARTLATGGYAIFLTEALIEKACTPKKPRAPRGAGAGAGAASGSAVGAAASGSAVPAAGGDRVGTRAATRGAAVAAADDAPAAASGAGAGAASSGGAASGARAGTRAASRSAAAAAAGGAVPAAGGARADTRAAAGSAAAATADDAAAAAGGAGAGAAGVASAGSGNGVVRISRTGRGAAGAAAGILPSAALAPTGGGQAGPSTSSSAGAGAAAVSVATELVDSATGGRPPRKGRLRAASQARE